MATRPRWLVYASLGIAVALVAGLVAVLGQDEQLTSIVGTALSGTSQDASDASASTATQAGPATAGTLTTTESSDSTASKPKVKDKPTPPSATPPSPGEQPDESWQEFIADTREIVENNSEGLSEAVALITTAIDAGDEDALTDLIAPDEGSQDTYAADLALSYPDIQSSDVGSNVDVFVSGEATIYVAYVLVTWEDAGVISEHTIPIMLRFTDGEWHLTTLGDTGAELQFVQSVVL